MAMGMKIFLLLMLMVVDVRAPYDVKVKIASTPASRVRNGVYWRMEGSITWGSGSNWMVYSRGYINVHHPMTEDIGDLREFYFKVFGADSWLVAEWADVYHYKQKKVYRFILRRISGSERNVARFYNPTVRRLCTNKCKAGFTWAHPSCDCAVCEDSAMSFRKYRNGAVRCGYNYVVKIKPALCAESRVNHWYYVKYAGEKNDYHSYIALSSRRGPYTATAGLFELSSFVLKHAGIISSLTMILYNPDWLDAEWVDVYDYYKGVVYRFVLRKVTRMEWTVVTTFTNPSTRILESSPTRSDAVMMCHFHNTYLWREQHGTPTYRNKPYPCTHIVFGKDSVKLENDLDNRPVKIFDSLDLQRNLKDLAAIDRKEKVLLHLKVDSFEFDLDKVVSILRQYLRYHYPGTDRRPYKGFELDIGQRQYFDIANNASLTQLLKAMREMMDAEPTQNELSVVVNSNNTLYDIDSLSKYADYVVVNAVVDEWPGHSPDDMSTVSPSSLYKANTDGESQRQSVARWLSAGLPREKIILPFTTYAWNTRYCLKGKPCVEYYNISVPHTQQFVKNSKERVYKIPYRYVKGRNSYVSWVEKMQTGPGVPYENSQTVLKRMDFLKAEGLRGTKVIDIMWDTDNFELTSIAYTELVGDFDSNSVDPAASTGENGGPGAGTGGLSAVLVTTIICVHLYAGIELHPVMM